MAAGEHMTGVHADPQSGIIDLRDKVDEGRALCQHLRALTRRCLEQNGTGRCGGLQAGHEIGAHGGQRDRQLLGGRLAHVDDHAQTAERHCDLERLDEERRVKAVIRLRTQIDEVGTVNEEAQTAC